MAYTSVLPVHRLDRSIDYVKDRAKTTKSAGSLEEAIDYACNREKTEETIFEDAMGCTCENAYADMVKTKERFHKKEGVQGYHLVQSFAEGEVSPELAHLIGQELAEQMLKNTSGLMNGKRIGVVAGNARTEESKNRVRGFCEVMEAGGGRIIWKYNQESKEDAGEILKAKEKVDYLAVLDPYILDEVGEKAENGFYSGAEIYGIGTSIKAFSLLDAGKIQCLIVPDLYEVGYESMNEIAGKLKNSWYQMESHETEIQVVYKKDLFSEDIERFLYSYE